MVSTGQGIIGNNMFAYCNNNPVNNIDPSGEFPWLVLGILVATTAVGGILGYNSKIKLGQINDEQSDIGNYNNSDSQSNSNDELSNGDKVKNSIIGAGLGLALSGAVLATGGAISVAVGGINSTYLGLSAIKAFATGALAFDISSFAILPIFNIDLGGIEYKSS